MDDLPDGYEFAATDPLGPDDADRGRAVVRDGLAGRLFVGRMGTEGPTAALLARAWSRCRHPGLVPIGATGGTETTWFVTAAVGPAEAPSLSELFDVFEAVAELHADGQRHGRIVRSLVRGEDGLQLLPPWGARQGDDHLALAQLLATALAGGPITSQSETVTLSSSAPVVLGGVLGALRDGRGMVVDALVALRECEEFAEPGTELALSVMRPPMALVPGEPPPPFKHRVAGPASLRARGLPLGPRDPMAVQALWTHLRDVATSGRPTGVVLRGDDGAVDGWEEWLQRTLEGWGLAHTLCLWGGDAASLRAALHPGGVRGEEVEGRWLAEAGLGAEEGRAEARRIRRWCGPLEAGERRGPAAVGRWELQRRLDASAGRGLVVLTMAAPTVEGVHLARDLCRGDAPVLVVLLVPDERAGDEALQEALTQGAFADVMVRSPRWSMDEAVDGDEVLAALGLEDLGEPPRKLLQRLEARGDGAAADDDSTALDALAACSGAARRVRDAVHLAALAPTPVAILDTFLGPAQGLWHATRLVRAVGAVGTVAPGLVADARARSDVAYLHRRLGRAWLRSGRANAAWNAGRHASAAGLGDDALDALEKGAAEAHGARDGRQLARVADALDAVGGASSVWRARAAQLRREEATTHWSALADEGGAVGAEAAVALARMALAAGADDAAEQIAAARALCVAAGDVGLEGETYALGGRLADQGDDDRGHGDYAKALHRLARAGRSWEAADTLVHQADGRARRGHLSEARELYEDAAEAFLEVDDGPSAVRARLGVALCHAQVDELDEAMVVAERAQVEARAWLDPRGGVRAAALRARVERHAGAADAAGARYERVVRDARELGLTDVVVDAEIGRSLLALARGDQHQAYECTTAAAAALESLPGHRYWPRYRLAVAGQLAKRGDHMQTWQWLWSANELGLNDADRDVAELANQICHTAKLEGWGNVIRVSAAVAVEQLRRLGDEGEAERLRTDITGFITK